MSRKLLHLSVALLLGVSYANGAVVRLKRGDIPNHAWAISKIVPDGDDGIATDLILQAMQQRVFSWCNYPPVIVIGNWAVCYATASFINFSTGTILLPSLDSPVSAITARQFEAIEDKFPGYTYTENDRDGTQVTKLSFERTRVASGSDVRELIVELLDQIGNSKSRDKPVRIQSEIK